MLVMSQLRQDKCSCSWELWEWICCTGFSAVLVWGIPAPSPRLGEKSSFFKLPIFLRFLSPEHFLDLGDTVSRQGRHGGYVTPRLLMSRNTKLGPNAVDGRPTLLRALLCLQQHPGLPPFSSNAKNSCYLFCYLLCFQHQQYYLSRRIVFVMLPYLKPYHQTSLE